MKKQTLPFCGALQIKDSALEFGDQIYRILFSYH